MTKWGSDHFPFLNSDGGYISQRGCGWEVGFWGYGAFRVEVCGFLFDSDDEYTAEGVKLVGACF